MHNVSIRKVVNGYVVEVGCETFVFNSLTNLLEELGLYLTNPAERIKSWGPLLKKYHDMSGGEAEPEEPFRDRPGGIIASPRAQREVAEGLMGGGVSGGAAQRAYRGVPDTDRVR